MKAWRQTQILDVIDREAVTSQEGLKEALLARGLKATQATISRDLKELGLVKRAGDGAYARPGTTGPTTQAAAEQLRKALSQLTRSIERVDGLIVVKTDRGQAQGLAEWFDRARLPEVAGTIAGDDTILLVCRHGSAEVLDRRLQAMARA
jgi:transcriptional regulator of arginine metabolism